jgi:hypothetical protein
MESKDKEPADRLLMKAGEPRHDGWRDSRDTLLRELQKRYEDEQSRQRTAATSRSARSRNQ